MIFTQPGDPLEQGQWLKVLITEAGNTSPPSHDCSATDAVAGANGDVTEVGTLVQKTSLN